MIVTQYLLLNDFADVHICMLSILKIISVYVTLDLNCLSVPMHIRSPRHQLDF